MGVTLTALIITCVATITADGTQGLGLGALSRAQPGRIVRVAPTGRLTVQAFKALSPDAKRAYAIGFVDGLGNGDAMLNLLYPDFAPCVADLTDQQVSDTIANAVDALESTAAEALVQTAANRALHDRCPSAPRRR